MIDSNNIEIIRDNLKELDQKIENLDVEIPPHTSGDAGKYLGVDSSGDLEFSNPLPAHPSTDAGKYLGVDSSGNLEFSDPLPDYSETETATGQKWIDGKEIYFKVFIGTTNDQTGNEAIGNIGANTYVINFYGLYKDKPYVSSDLRRSLITNIYTNGATGDIVISKTSILTETEYIIIVYYTKPSATRDDTEPSPETLTKKKKSK